MPAPRSATSRFVKVLLDAGVIDELQLKSLSAKMDSFGWTLPRAIAELGFADEESIVETIGQALKVPTVQLGNVLRDNGALKALGVDYCEKFLVFPLTLKDKVLTLAVTDPTDLRLLDEAGSRARARVSPVM